MTTVLETFGTIRPDGTLELDQKLAGPPGRVKVRVESIEAPDAELAKRFAELNAAWKEGTRFTSKIKTMKEHPAFREMVAIGEKAVALILNDLEKKGGFGFLALEEITGVDPLPHESQFNHDQLADAWLAWGRAKGYRW